MGSVQAQKAINIINLWSKIALLCHAATKKCPGRGHEQSRWHTVPNHVTNRDGSCADWMRMHRFQHCVSSVMCRVSIQCWKNLYAA